MKPRWWRFRVALGWMWCAFLGTLAFAPAFGGFVGLAGSVAHGESIIEGLVWGVAIGLIYFAWMVAAVAMVVSPPVALLMTRKSTDVISPGYSRRVRLAVASALAMVSLPLAVLLSRGGNHPLIQLAEAMLPLFVFVAAMSFGHISVAYTREFLDPATAMDPEVLRRITRDRAEARFQEMRSKFMEMLASGMSEREVAAFITYEARMDFDESQRRVALLLEEMGRPVADHPPPPG